MSASVIRGQRNDKTKNSFKMMTTTVMIMIMMMKSRSRRWSRKDRNRTEAVTLDNYSDIPPPSHLQHLSDLI